MAYHPAEGESPESRKGQEAADDTGLRKEVLGIKGAAFGGRIEATAARVVEGTVSTLDGASAGRPDLEALKAMVGRGEAIVAKRGSLASEVLAAAVRDGEAAVATAHNTIARLQANAADHETEANQPA